MRNHGFFYLVASVAIAIATAGGAAAQSTVKVGMVMPLTGTLADAGKQVVAGARLYMAEHGVTVAGKRVELIVKDDASSYETGKRLIQEAIVNDKVNIIAGGTSGDLFAAAPVITAAKVPTVIMISSTSAVIAKSPYYVRTSTTIAQSSTIMADWSIRNGIKKVVTLVSDFAPGLEAETTFKSRYLAAGGQIFDRYTCRCRIPTLRPSCNGYAMTAHKPSSSLCRRSRPELLPNNSRNAVSTRLASGSLAPATSRMMRCCRPSAT